MTGVLAMESGAGILLGNFCLGLVTEGVMVFSILLKFILRARAVVTVFSISGAWGLGPDTSLYPYFR